MLVTGILSPFQTNVCGSRHINSDCKRTYKAYAYSTILNTSMAMGEQHTVLTLASEIWVSDKCKSPGKLIVHHWKAIHKQCMLWANGLVPSHLYYIALIKRWLASSQAGTIDKNYGLTPDASINKKPEIIGKVIDN